MAIPGPARSLLTLVTGVLLACGGAPGPSGEGSLSPTAQPQITESLQEDLAAERHPSDGGGRAWLAEGEAATVGGTGRWTLVYEAGPLGIAPGGVLFLQVSPFWGWSTPQVESPESFGYTRVSTEADGVHLEPWTVDQQLLGIEIQGRKLEPGERVRIEYGAGELGAQVDRYAERRSRFWIAVDGDGDGIRGLLADSPAVDVLPGPPHRLLLFLPATARPGDSLELTVAVVDAIGNAGMTFSGTVEIQGGGDLLELPLQVELTPEDAGSTTVQAVALAPGVVRLTARAGTGLEGESNPLRIDPEAPRILWGDLHGHSQLSDGTGTAEDYFTYAREVAALDVAALTDHDHWGMRPLAHTPSIWEEIRRQVARHHDPGRFVTLLGYEWTSWLHGHRHVLYFADDGEVFSSVDPAYEHPEQLWEALHAQGVTALTFAHHSAGGPVATNWEVPPDPRFEPVTEIVSVHGSSEALDSPGVIYSPQPGNFVRDVLDRGYRLGFVGSGDSHDGHPGLTHLAAPSSGLAAILSQELSRAGVLEALRARRVYATNGPRIILYVHLDGRPMGSTLPPGATATLETLAVAPRPLAHLEIVRSGWIVESRPAGGVLELADRRQIQNLRAGEYLYVRALMADGGAAWSSPFFIGEQAP